VQKLGERSLPVLMMLLTLLALLVLLARTHRRAMTHRSESRASEPDIPSYHGRLSMTSRSGRRVISTECIRKAVAVTDSNKIAMSHFLDFRSTLSINVGACDILNYMTNNFSLISYNLDIFHGVFLCNLKTRNFRRRDDAGPSCVKESSSFPSSGCM